jgi:hypothetical protein
VLSFAEMISAPHPIPAAAFAVCDGHARALAALRTVALLQARAPQVDGAGGPVDATALISNARSFPWRSTAVGHIEGRMLDPAGWLLVTMAVKVWFTASTEITFTYSSLAKPNARKTKRRAPVRSWTHHRQPSPPAAPLLPQAPRLQLSCPQLHAQRLSRLNNGEPIEFQRLKEGLGDDELVDEIPTSEEMVACLAVAGKGGPRQRRGPTPDIVPLYRSRRQERSGQASAPGGPKSSVAVGGAVSDATRKRSKPLRRLCRLHPRQSSSRRNDGRWLLSKPEPDTRPLTRSGSLSTAARSRLTISVMRRSAQFLLPGSGIGERRPTVCPPDQPVDVGVPTEASPIMKKIKPTELLLLTRPYSWIDTVLNVLVGLVWSGGAYSGTRYLSAATIALLLWFSLNWISEAIQHDPGRNPPGLGLAVGPLLVAGVWAVQVGGVRSVPWLAVYIALVFVYPWKARNSLLGPFGPALRGLQTGALYMLGASFGAGFPVSLRIVFSLALVQAARSLVADIRDIHTDVYELPKRIGKRASKWFAIALLISGIITLPPLHPGHLEPQFVLIAMLVLLIVIRLDYSYELHFAFIILFATAKMAIFLELLGEFHHLEWLVLIPVQLTLSTTYWQVPRRSNVTFRDHMERAIRLVAGG